MGMYTEFVCGLKLAENTPKEVIDILKYMARDAEEPASLPDHVFFQSARWRSLFVCASSYFIPAEPVFEIEEDGTQYQLIVRSSIKNYDDQIQKFIGWISDHVFASKGQFLGYMHYEEDQFPDLIIHPCQFITPDTSMLPKWLRWIGRLSSMFEGTKFER